MFKHWLKGVLKIRIGNVLFRGPSSFTPRASRPQFGLLYDGAVKAFSAREQKHFITTSANGEVKSDNLKQYLQSIYKEKPCISINIPTLCRMEIFNVIKSFIKLFIKRVNYLNVANKTNICCCSYLFYLIKE